MKLQTNYIQRQNKYGEKYRISYTAWGDPSAEKTLFCVHGLNRNSRDFDFVADYVQQYGYYIVAPDLPGRGNSDYLVDQRGYSLESSLADIVTLIEQLKLVNLDFIGVSLGGILGILLASRSNQIIQRLILSDIGPEVELAGIARIAAYSQQQPDFASFAEAADYLRCLSGTDGIYIEEVWRHMLLNSFQKNAQQRWELKRDVKLGLSLAEEVGSGKRVEFWAQWEKIRLPTLLIHGLQSDLLSLPTIARMQLLNPQTEILRIADAGHAPYLYRLEHLARIGRFLRGLITEEHLIEILGAKI